MFTGLVEEIGKVKSLVKQHVSAKMIIQAKKVLENLAEGDSIAINGVCLTVTGFTSNTFTVDVMAETLKKTSLGYLSEGSEVNLERALKIGGRLGGHFVTGHVDATGTVTSMSKRGIATDMWIRFPPELKSFIIPQGSVALDGVSLTIADLKTDSFLVSLIPHTLKITTLGNKRIGDIVNVECDVLGKYIRYLISNKDYGKEEISFEFLAKHGFV